MEEMPDSFKNLQGAMPAQTDIRNYKTSASEEQVLQTLGEMKKSFMADGMPEAEADMRVSMMLEAYGIAKEVFKDYYNKNSAGL
jgi:hypothetical protein